MFFIGFVLFEAPQASLAKDYLRSHPEAPNLIKNVSNVTSKSTPEASIRPKINKNMAPGTMLQNLLHFWVILGSQMGVKMEAQIVHKRLFGALGAHLAPTLRPRGSQRPPEGNFSYILSPPENHFQ